MINFKNYFLAENIEDAYEELLKNRKNRIIGGGSYLRLSNLELHTIIDLEKIGLNQITEDDDYIKIGAMVTFRELETNPIIKNYFDGVISDAVSGILGVQFRNNVTVGATVFSKYGFSDLNTALLAVNAEVILYKNGKETLENFLKSKKILKDILVEIKLPKKNGKSVFKCVRKSSTDYSIINLAVSQCENKKNYRVCIGATPKRATVAYKFSDYLNTLSEELKIIDNDKKKEFLEKRLNENVLSLIDQDITFESNTRATDLYRRILAKNLIKKSVMEVICSGNKSNS
ncbi:MAG: FAD binding domain-containing protein [Fusobacteriaceae bacterium]|nr:FAD binding domain-containing protein [Fusobacteriaceae bacterium]MBP9509638.1 FAD binding domain-containing protein [Fusobacteriaceae bacterium]